MNVKKYRFIIYLFYLALKKFLFLNFPVKLFIPLTNKSIEVDTKRIITKEIVETVLLIRLLGINKVIKTIPVGLIVI